MTVSHWKTPHKGIKVDHTTDVLILGAGYVGLSVAYWLSELCPGQKITVIDRSHIGAGASGRNAGFLTKGSAAFYQSLSQEWGSDKAQEIFKFAKTSLELVHEHILTSSKKIIFEKTHSLTLLDYRNKLKDWKEATNFNFEWIEQENLPAHLRSEFGGGLQNQTEYKVNPMQLLLEMREILQKRNVLIFEGLSGFKIHSRGVTTTENEIVAKKVVLALNGYFPQFHSIFKDIITPCRAQMLAVKLNRDFDCPALHYDPEGRVYWRKGEDNTLLIGGKRLLDAGGEIGDFEKVTDIIQMGLENYLKDRLKISYDILHRWSGTMAFTKHELPFISKINGPLEAFGIGGFSGHGMGFGFHSALEMASLITGKMSNSFFDKIKPTSMSL